MFQWLVAIISRVGITLDQAGRLTSWTLYILGIILSGRVLGRLSGDRRLTLIFWTLWLFSPLYVFWSRAFMIESCAVTLSLAFVCCILEYQRDLGRAHRVRLAATLVLMAVVAALAATVKITTFFSFALAGAGLTLWKMWQARKTGAAASRIIAIGAGPAAAVAWSLVCTLAWVRYSDSLKMSSVLGRHLTAASLQDWNFGPKFILDPIMWKSVILYRSLLDALGSPVPFIVAFLYVPLTRRGAVSIASGITLYIAPFCVFTNLHLVHNYYQYANGVFAILAVSGAIWAMGTQQRLHGLFVAVTLMLLVIGADVYRFAVQFWPAIHDNATAQRTLEIADLVKNSTSPNDVVVVVAFGWSTEIAYYSERRTIALPAWSIPDLELVTPSELTKWAGGGRIGGIVDCPGTRDDTAIHRWIAPVEAEDVPKVILDCRVYLEPHRGTGPPPVVPRAA